MRNLNEEQLAAAADIRDGRLLRLIYALYFGCGGLALTYVPYHLSAIGLTAGSIGLLFGGRTLLAIVGQPILSTLAEQLGRPRRVLASAFVIGLVCTALLPYARTFPVVALAVWLPAPFLATMLPLLDAFVVRTQGLANYGRVRLWGSVGFGAIVAGFGLLVGRTAHAIAGELAIYGYMALCAAGTIAAFAMRPQPGLGGQRRDLARFSPGWRFVPFVLGNMLHWSSCAIANIYFALHLRDSGMAAWVPGVGVGVAIVGEVAAFAFAARLVARWRAGTWYVVVCLAGVIRWVVTAQAPSVPIVVGAQLIHLLSFGVWFSLAMQQLGRFAAPERRTTLQGVFSAGCFALGSLIGSVAGGAVMDAWSSAAAFYLAAALELVALAVLLFAQRVLPAEPRD